MNHRTSGSSGVTLIELLITAALILLVVGVALPAAEQIRDGDQVARILALAERVGRACERHRQDTGRPAVELSAAVEGHSYARPRYHQLAKPQPYGGWNGPYLESSLARGDNPFGGAVYLQNHLAAAPAHGFDLDGDGTNDHAGAGQFLVLYGVPESIAVAVDETLDSRLPTSAPWHATGRVEWLSGSGGALVIFIEGTTDGTR